MSLERPAIKALQLDNRSRPPPGQAFVELGGAVDQKALFAATLKGLLQLRQRVNAGRKLLFVAAENGVTVRGDEPQVV